MANPAIVLTPFSLTTSASEQNLFDITADKYYRAYLNLKNMQSGDTFEVKIYVRDIQLDEDMHVETFTYTNAQSPVGKRLVFEASSKYRVTIRRTAGVDRVVTGFRVQV